MELSDIQLPVVSGLFPKEVDPLLEETLANLQEITQEIARRRVKVTDCGGGWRQIEAPLTSDDGGKSWRIGELEWRFVP